MMRTIQALKRCALKLIGSEALFIFAWFILTLMRSMDPFFWEPTQIDVLVQYIMLPWGVSLAVMYLQRQTRPQAARVLLLLLLGWIVVPFALRFGVTQKNVSSWMSAAVLFFGVYASISGRSAQERERVFSWLTRLFALAGWVLGAALLFCAAAAKGYYSEFGQYAFGVFEGKQLSAGCHYNVTAMACLCIMMLSLAGLCRARHAAARLYYAPPAVMMALVIVLTQSRTSRYAMLFALALSAWRMVALGRMPGRRLVRHVSAIAAAAVVAAGGFILADAAVKGAIVHYARVQAQSQQAAEPSAERAQAPREDEQAAAGQADAKEEQKLPKSRTAMNSTFTGRTVIWTNLIALWKENPRYFLIGQGVGRTGWLIADGTPLESLGYASVHNAYLQFIADYGFIALALLLAFAVSIAPALLRIFFRDRWADGYAMLCVTAAAMLVVGLMESDPLAPMSMTNLALYASLALAAPRGKERKPLSHEDHAVV